MICKGKTCPASDFYVQNKKTGALRCYCKACDKYYRSHREYKYPKHRICPDCEEDLPIKDYNFRNETSGEREKRCGKCAYAMRDKEKRREQYKNWYENKNGRNFVKNYNNEYKERRNELNKIRRAKDPNYRIMMNVRCRIGEILKKHGMHGDHKIKYLGIDVQTYKDWLEYQFDDDMTWANYGTYWHIDHVKPCASFTFKSTKDPNVFECFNWKNTRPMIAKDNLAKGDKIDQVAIISQKIIVNLFKFEYGLEDDS